MAAITIPASSARESWSASLNERGKVSNKQSEPMFAPSRVVRGAPA